MRRGYAVLAVPIVSGALALVWWAPWSSSPDPVARARQAFGDRPVVHAVVRFGIPLASPPNLQLSRRPFTEVWYDPAHRRTHLVDRQGGRVTEDAVGSFPPAGPFPIFTPFRRFVVNYRSELADGRLRAGGAGRIQDRAVLWLRSPDLLVAIDPVSYEPLWLRDEATHPALLTQLVVAETVPFDAVDFQTQRQKKPRHL